MKIRFDEYPKQSTATGIGNVSLCCFKNAVPECYSCTNTKVMFHQIWGPVVNSLQNFHSHHYRIQSIGTKVSNCDFLLGLLQYSVPSNIEVVVYIMMGICYITDYQNANPSRNTQRLHIIHHDSFSMFWLSSFQSFIDKNSWLNKTFCIWFCTFTHVLITITNRLHFQCTL